MPHCWYLDDLNVFLFKEDPITFTNENVSGKDNKLSVYKKYLQYDADDQNVL